MNWEKIHKRIILLICVITLVFINSNYAYGAVSVESMEFIPKNIEKTTNGADVEINSNGAYEDELNVSMNTRGLDSGYYTTYLYENQSYDWSKYEAMAFDVSNESDDSMRINLNIKKSDNTVVSVSDNSAVLVKKENTEIMERVHPSYGTIELPKDFKGTLIIPFNSLKEDNSVSDNINEISKISSWGIITVLKQNEEKSFKLSKFSLVNKGSSIDELFNLNFSIKGDSTVEIPAVGESICYYNIDWTNKDENINMNNVKFQLMNPIAGITIDDNGRLTIKSQVKPQKIQICAMLDENLREVMDVQLLNSWTANDKELDGTIKGIPKPNEVPGVTKNKSVLLENNILLIVIRISILIVTFAFGILYWYWKRNEKG